MSEALKQAMVDSWAVMSEQILDYIGYNVIIILFAISLIYILVRCREKRITIGITTILLLIIIVNPLLYYYVWDRLFDYGYWRALWIIPLVVVIAYAATRVIRDCNSIIIKTAILCAITLLFACGGNYMYDSGVFVSAENQYKIPQEAIDVSEAVMEINDSNGTVIMPSSLYCYVRQYTTQIHLYYGRDVEGYILYPGAEIVSVKVYLQAGIADIVNTIPQGEVQIIVLEKNSTIDSQTMEEKNYYFIESIDGYSIYKLAQEQE